MTDLKSLAYEFLHEAQETLQREGHPNPVAAVITASENLILELEFQTGQEREDIYGEMMDVAREKRALAILTVNDVFLTDSGTPPQLQGAGWGTASETAQEAIMITVSGSGFETWTLVCPYFRREPRVVFQPAREVPNPGGEIDLLGDWTGKTSAA